MSSLVAIEHNNPELDRQIKVEWHLGLFCNYNCSYCSSTSHSRRPKHLNLEKVKVGIGNLLRYSSVHNRVLRIEFTGGEPTMHPQFIQILRYANSQGVQKLSTTTNGSRLLEYYQEAMSFLESITISFHMEYNLKPKELLQKINSLNRYLKTLLEKKFLKVHVMFLPGMLPEVLEIREYLRSRGIRFAIRRIRPTYQADHPDNEYYSDGRLKRGKILRPFQNDKESVLLHLESQGVDHGGGESDYYSSEELEFIQSEEASANFSNVKVYRSNGEASHETVNDISARRENRFTNWICWAGIQSLRVGYDGTLRVGNCQLPSLGNIFGEFRISESPVRCRNAWCSSATNLNTTKVKDESFLPLTREGRSID